jgi:hypothetical protein
MTSTISRVVGDTKTETINYETFRKSFDTAYKTWFRSNSIAQNLRKIMNSYQVTPEEFEKLTQNREFQHYIALIDGKIRFDELPGPPHGAIVGSMVKLLARQLDGPNNVEILRMVNDDGMLSCAKF